jgi:hypothetical protein
MNILCLLEANHPALCQLTNHLAQVLSHRATVQIMFQDDIRPNEWIWADVVLFGLTHTFLSARLPRQNKITMLADELVAEKPFTLYQVQSHADSPLTAAYAFGLARELRARQAKLVAAPRVFFSGEARSHMDEGETLRAGLWLSEIMRQVPFLSNSV